MAPDSQLPGALAQQPLPGTMEENQKALREAFRKHRGIIFREVPLDRSCETRTMLVVFVEGSTDLWRLEAHIIRPAIEGTGLDPTKPGGMNLAPGFVVIKTMGEATSHMLRGKVLVQLDSSREMLAMEIGDHPHREVMPPENESGVSGPRESFVELLMFNMAMLRRRLPGPQLRMESVWIGDKAPLECVITYVADRPPERIIQTVRDRLSKVKVDGVQEVLQLSEAVADVALTTFPTVLPTERPDTTIHYLLAGRVAVLVENSPRALIMPAFFIDFFASVDDFYEWRPFVVFLRMLRFLAFNIAVPLPALYVSVTTYHLQALPTQLTLSLLAQREGAPLPPPIEATLMTLTFEILREAGVRLPKAIGPTVSIVGGLVIGDAAIRSGLTSPAMVAVVSATAVATFALPSTTMANSATYYRFGLLALASAFGFFGVMLGYLVALTNLATLTTMGLPYAAPFMPIMFKDFVSMLGLKARPPKTEGTRPASDLVKRSDKYQERKK